MIHFNWHIVLPIMVMSYVWWLIIVRFLVDFTGMYLAIRGQTARIFFTTMLMNFTVYAASWLLIDCLFAYAYPRLDILGLRFLWVSLENALRPGMGSISFTFIAVFIMIFAVNFGIEYAIARAAFPNADQKKLMIYLLLATSISTGLSMRAAYVKESQRIAFIHAIEDDAVVLKYSQHGIEAVYFYEPLFGYEKGDEVKGYNLAYHLQDVVDAYKKEHGYPKKKK